MGKILNLYTCFKLHLPAQRSYLIVLVNNKTFVVAKQRRLEHHVSAKKKIKEMILYKGIIRARVDYQRLWYNAKFWCAPIGRNQSRDAIVSHLSGHLSAHSARFWQFLLKI